MRCSKSLREFSFILLTLLLFMAKAAWGVASVEVSVADDQNMDLDLLKKIEYLQQEMQELRGKVEEQSYQLQQLQDNQKKLSSNAAAKSTTGSGITLDISDPLPKAKSEGSSLSEEKSYQQAYKLVQNKEFDNALKSFLNLVSNYPQGKYTPNAYYWMGEIYLIKEDPNLAANAFNTVINNFPQHPKTADCLLKLGNLEYAKSQWKRSQQLFNQVKIQFPGTTSAQLADSKLQRMQQEGHI